MVITTPFSHSHDKDGDTKGDELRSAKPIQDHPEGFNLAGQAGTFHTKDSAS